MQETIEQLFFDLYESTIIYHEKGSYFCQFLRYDYSEGILKIRFKMIEPVFKMRPFQKYFYEKMKQKEFLEVSTKIPNGLGSRIDIEKKKLIVPYASYVIFTDADLVKNIYELKENGNEEAMYDLLWE